MRRIRQISVGTRCVEFFSRMLRDVDVEDAVTILSRYLTSRFLVGGENVGVAERKCLAHGSPNYQVSRTPIDEGFHRQKMTHLT